MAERCADDCPLGGSAVQHKPEFCRRCRPAEFDERAAKVRFQQQELAASLTWDLPNPTQCDVCGEFKVRRDGFCYGCATYISYQVTEGQRMTWTNKLAVKANPKYQPEAPRQASFAGMGGPVTTKRR
jgi:hypothetical protein